ncbi:MAG: hypothetical protein AAB421_02880 [Patescibacteria group bacterium]
MNLAERRNEFTELHKEMNSFMHELTKGQYPNSRNLYHVYYGHHVDHPTNFDPNERIDPKRLRGGLYFTNSESSYLFTFKPLIVFSPQNPLLRRFVRQKNSGKYSSSALQKFVMNDEQPTESSEGTLYTKFSENEDRLASNVTWARVASCIVDFDNSKVYFYN